MDSNNIPVPLRILLVEDSEHDVLAFRRAFERNQIACEITRCTQAEESLKRLGADTASFDLVVTDYKLPGMNGLELCRELLDREIPLPLVLLTGTGSEHLAVEALKAGVDDYLVKDPAQGYLTLLPVVLPDVVQRHSARLVRQRAEEALQRRNRGLAMLNQVGQELVATLDLQQVTVRSLQAVTEIIGAEGASVWLWDEGQNKGKSEVQEDWLICRVVFHQGQGRSPANLRLRSGQGVVGWVAQNGESVVVASTSDDPRFSSTVDEQTGFRTVSLLAVPLQVRGSILGVLEVVNKLSGDFDTDDQILVETLAASAAIAIDNARLVRALRQYTVKLEARNEELDAFAHTVAHDLKGPLGYMVGFAQVLEEDHTALPGKDLRRALRTIVQSGHKMSSIIDELLLLAGVRKIGEAKLEPLSMDKVVTGARQRLAHMIEEYQAEIISPATWPTTRGYGPWVEEVWVNYLSNGIKYGGRPPRVELGATLEMDGMVRFWVRDNGRGISPEAQARLFTPFTRLDQVSVEGHGLGLSIVRRIVEKLGGKVSVESQVGQGSVFAFTLPSA
ncbi:MAG: ATP-binding protein [Chloroflexota bacterium]|nr:ATP-binding protein [Chloroflexota bacterium]